MESMTSWTMCATSSRRDPTAADVANVDGWRPPWPASKGQRGLLGELSRAGPL